MVGSLTINSSYRSNNMQPIRIITDGSIQFSQPSFPGRELVDIVPHTIHLNGSTHNSEVHKVASLPPHANRNLHPGLFPPSVELLRETIASSGSKNSGAICIFMSSGLSSCYENACRAVETQPGKLSVQVIDSQTTSVGLGLLVQTAALAASQGASLVEIDRLVRSQLQRIYAVVCVPGLSYLYYNHLLDLSQATVGEMMGLYPIFSLEDGRLTPLEKVRNHRHVMDFFQEFLDEFDQLTNIALIQTYPPNPGEARLLRDHAQTNFGQPSFTEHTINLPLATLLGPRTLSLFVLEQK
jgi:DegV family protein with EDD domain